jgi:hypothetical protein
MPEQINESMVHYAHPDLAGLCRSPHDFPPKWAFMLTLYLDESLEADEGYAVVAGFMGNDKAWEDCMAQWRVGLGKTPALHMKSLRGWNKSRNDRLLKRLGEIPAKCGLTLIYASVKYSDYSDLVKNTGLELVAEGYLTSLFFAVAGAIKRTPDTERIEVICEQQVEYAALREAMFRMASRFPEWQTPEGNSRLAKWSSIPKSMILEPSDYAAYAILQMLRNPTSLRSKACSPILRNPRRIGWNVPGEHMRSGMGKLMETISRGDYATMTKKQKREYRAMFKQGYGGTNDGQTEPGRGNEEDSQRV